ncbi:LytR/AlgR family response regulator transcription factor [Variovorax sp. IB41]|uniref:LytR/AlgR family response regulator transcription factor n=1 Tax=Variovorax sp. IB41 TaxID=2779370 RepID=UPI0018E7EA23|nr:LytTR family DNA-binding domain-containing protein [Variovorax sp. IB41]
MAFTAFTALAVDDEPLALEALQGHCASDGRVRLIATAANGIEALQRVDALRPDAIFLDIGMPGLGGLEVATRLQALDKPPLVVFVTAYDHFAAEAFDLAVADYMLKPLRAERFRRAIDKLSDVLGQRKGSLPCQADDLWLPRRGTVVRVPIASIVRVEAERDYAKVHTAQEVFMVRTTMSAIEERLPADRFVRIHRSTIVAVDQIGTCRHLGNGAWVAVDLMGESRPIGRHYLGAVRQALGIQG